MEAQQSSCGRFVILRLFPVGCAAASLMLTSMSEEPTPPPGSKLQTKELDCMAGLLEALEAMPYASSAAAA